MDQKPFQAQVDGQAAALQRNQAALRGREGEPRAHQAARRSRTRCRRRTSTTRRASTSRRQAAVAQGKAPARGGAAQSLVHDDHVAGRRRLAAYAAVADGTYVNPQNAQLTTVSVLTPMWINFSVSENELERIRSQVQAGQLTAARRTASSSSRSSSSTAHLFPYTGQDHVRGPVVQLADGNVPDPRVRRQSRRVCCARTSTSARASRGAIRPNAILIPQRAVQQGAKGHFVWVVNKDSKAELRPVVVGDWYGEGWFISQGLAAGDQVVVDGAIAARARTLPVKATPYAPKPRRRRKARRCSAPTGRRAARSSTSRRGKATLDAEAQRAPARLRAGDEGGHRTQIDVTGLRRPHRQSRRPTSSSPKRARPPCATTSCAEGVDRRAHAF